jgi:hypothetical protein
MSNDGETEINIIDLVSFFCEQSISVIKYDASSQDNKMRLQKILN